MKTLTNILLYIIYVLTTISCSQHTQSLPQIDIPKSDSINLHKVSNINLWYCDVMEICDSSIIIIDRYQDEKLHIYNLSDFSFKAKIGQIGRGPTDSLFPFFVKTNHSDSIRFTISDASLMKIKTFSLKNGIKDSIVNLVEEIHISPNILTSTDMVQKNDIYYGTTDDMNGIFFIYNMSNDSILWVKYPKSVQIKEDKLKISKQSRMTMNIKNNKIAVAMRYYNQLYIYDELGEIIKYGSFGKEITPIIEGDKLKDSSSIFFSSIYSTDNYIYLVLSDQIYRNTNFRNLPPTKIAIFDWDLNPIRLIQTNKLIRNIVIDSMYKRMFAICYDAEDNSEIFMCHWDETDILN